MVDWMALGLGVLVAGAVVAYLSRPWWARRTPAASEAEPVSSPAVQGLADRREALLTALRDLDFDHTIGKITAEDYGPMRQALLGEVATIMQQLEAQHRVAEAEVDARLETEVLAVRHKLQANRSFHAGQADTPCLSCGRVSEAGDIYCRGCGTGLNEACPACGAAVRPADHFCTGCGLELALALS